MNVRQLIKKLSELDPDATVIMYNEEFGSWHVLDVKQEGSYVYLIPWTDD